MLISKCLSILILFYSLWHCYCYLEKKIKIRTCANSFCKQILKSFYVIGSVQRVGDTLMNIVGSQWTVFEWRINYSSLGLWHQTRIAIQLFNSGNHWILHMTILKLRESKVLKNIQVVTASLSLQLPLQAHCTQCYPQELKLALCVCLSLCGLSFWASPSSWDVPTHTIPLFLLLFWLVFSSSHMDTLKVKRWVFFNVSSLIFYA